VITTGANYQGKKGAFMASETFKKRQKEMARKEKQKKKFDRRMERKTEKPKPEDKVEGEIPNGPTNL
jgi:hypothetical protein